MFTVPNYSPLAGLGRGLGEGVSDALQNNYEFTRDRNRLRTGLEDVRNVARDANGSADPLDLYIKLQTALAGVPGAQQNIADIFPKLHSSISRQGVFGEGGLQGSQQAAQGGGPQSRTRPVAGSTAPNNMQNNFETQYPQSNPLIQPSTRAPIPGQGMQPAVKSGTEMAQELEELYRRNVSPDVINAVKDIRTSENAGNRALKQDEIQELQYQKAQGDIRAQAEDRLRDALLQENPKMSPEDLSRKIKVSKKYENEPDLATRLRKTNTDFNNVQAQIESFRSNSERELLRGLIGDKKGASVREQTQRLVKEGYGDEAALILQQNGYGPAEVFENTNPLSRKERDAVASALGKRFATTDKQGDLKSGINTLPNGFTLPSALAGKTEDFALEKSKLKSLAKNIVDVVKPGYIDKNGSFIPGTNLYLMREEAIKRGLSWPGFRAVVDKALEMGLQLDDEQQRQNAMLSNRPQLGIADIFLNRR